MYSTPSRSLSQKLYIRFQLMKPNVEFLVKHSYTLWLSEKIFLGLPT